MKHKLQYYLLVALKYLYGYFDIMLFLIIGVLMDNPNANDIEIAIETVVAGSMFWGFPNFANFMDKKINEYK